MQIFSKLLSLHHWASKEKKTRKRDASLSQPQMISFNVSVFVNRITSFLLCEQRRYDDVGISVSLSHIHNLIVKSFNFLTIIIITINTPLTLLTLSWERSLSWNLFSAYRIINFFSMASFSCDRNLLQYLGVSILWKRRK